MVGLSARPSADRYAPRPGAVSIELSQAQLDQVVRDVSAPGTFSLALAGLFNVRETLGRAEPLLEDSRLSRSDWSSETPATRKYRITHAD
jgi:hypothetical protein